MNRIYVRPDPELYEQIRALAEAERRSTSQMASLLLERGVREILRKRKRENQEKAAV